MASVTYVRALLKRLRSNSEAVQVETAQSLGRLALESAEQREAIGVAGGVPVLLHLLQGSGSEAVQQAAARSLIYLCNDSLSNQQALVAARGIATLLQCSERGSGSDSCSAAAGNVAMLLGLLCSPCAGAAQRANTQQLVELGGIPVIVRLLRGGDARVQQGVAVVLANLHGGPPEHKSAVVEAGGMAALAAVLADSTDEAAQSTAAGSTVNLCFSYPAASRAAAAAGMVPTLVRLLRSRTSSSKVLGPAATCLSSVAVDNNAAVVAAGGIEALIGLCVCDTMESSVQAAAASSLRNLAASSPASKAAITAAGGVHAMVPLLRGSGSAAVQEAAAGLLRNMADDARDPTQQAFAASGAAAALVNLLGPSRRADVREEAVIALRGLAGRRAVHRQAIAAAGRVTALVCLLGFPGTEAARTSGLAVLRCLILDGSCTAAVVEAGGIGAFVSCLRSGSDQRIQVQAASALADLTRCNAEYRQPAAAHGAIPALAALVHSSGCVNELAAMASTAIKCIALGNRANSLAAATAMGTAPGTLMHAALAEVMFSGASVPGFQLPGIAILPAGVESGPAAVATMMGLSRGAAGVDVCARPGCGNTRGLRRCGACAAVRYCGTACATAHWKQHKAECRRLCSEAQHAPCAAPEATL